MNHGDKINAKAAQEQNLIRLGRWLAPVGRVAGLGRAPNPHVTPAFADDLGLHHFFGQWLCFPIGIRGVDANPGHIPPFVNFKMPHVTRVNLLVINGRYRRDMVNQLAVHLTDRVAAGTHPRDIAIVVPYLDGALRYMLARALQHETDHTLGTVFGDRIGDKARKKLRKAHDKAADDYPPGWPA